MRIPCHTKSISETEALLGLQGQGNERLPLNPPLPRREDAQGQGQKYFYLIYLSMTYEIKEVAKEIDGKFDYQNHITFDGDFLAQKYGENFDKEFKRHFSDEWHGALGDAIMYLDLPEIISRATRHALAECGIDHIDTGDYAGDDE